jgi:hypothetical protein
VSANPPGGDIVAIESGHTIGSGRTIGRVVVSGF